MVVIRKSKALAVFMHLVKCLSIYITTDAISWKWFVSYGTHNPYLATNSFTNFSPDPDQVIIATGHNNMRRAWVILGRVHKTRVGENLDR